MKGDPEAAIAMAETYDPVILGQLYIRGLQPDEAKAAAWYQKAMQLGDAMAKTRLNALNKK
jgi:TPR repeat protein